MQIGQIMLTMPNAMAKMGLIAALPLAVVIATMSLWSMKMLICLYVARRSILVSLSFPLIFWGTACLVYLLLLQRVMLGTGRSWVPLTSFDHLLVAASCCCF